MNKRRILNLKSLIFIIIFIFVLSTETTIVKAIDDIEMSDLENTKDILESNTNESDNVNTENIIDVYENENTENENSNFEIIESEFSEDEPILTLVEDWGKGVDKVDKVLFLL